MKHDGVDHPVAHGQGKGRVKVIRKWFSNFATASEMKLLKDQSRTDTEKEAIILKLHNLVVRKLQDMYKAKGDPKKTAWASKSCQNIELTFTALENHECTLRGYGWDLDRDVFSTFAAFRTATEDADAKHDAQWKAMKHTASQHPAKRQKT